MFRNLFHASRFHAPRTVAATAAVMVALFTGVVSAQPFGGPGGRGGMGGPGGPMAGGGGEQMIGHLIAEAKAKLNLDTSQQVQFDAAVAQGKAAREEGRALHQKARDAMRTELAKPQPNLAVAIAAADEAIEQGLARRKQVRDQWLKFYANLTSAQKSVVHEMLQARMDRMETFRQRMLQHHPAPG